ncbi:MAG: molybdopterin cofactor-binding domain-containing protein, partial [Pseudarthrobacter sp.]
PHLVRERNLYREGDYTPYGQPVKDAERGRRVWSELKLESGFEERRAAVAAFNAEQRHVKRGIAITPLKFGISFTAGFLNQSGALVIIYQDGTVQVNHGGTEMGQGLHTKMAQVAAQALGVPLSAIRVMVTSTDKVPNTSATAGSTGSDLNGAAVKDACDTLKQRLAAVAAGRLQAAAAEVVFEDGRVFPAGRREAAVPFAEVAMQAYLE